MAIHSGRRSGSSGPVIALRRILAGAAGAAIVAASVALTSAQVPVPVPGSSINMVSGTGWPGGDPFLQRQNEPSIAASTRNPLHLLAGANDYRTVDLPGLPNGSETGDAWLGVFTSFDGGRQWRSTLLPGYPQDSSPTGLSSPLHGFQAGADPVVRAGTNGLLYYSGLVFDRGTDAPSAVFVARFVDNNDKENGDAIAQVGTSVVAVNSGRDGVFLDKPWLAVDIPRAGSRVCHLPAPGPSGTTTAQAVPAGPVYVAYTAIRGQGATLRSSIMFSASYDCGADWTRPVRISDPRDRINQGATIAIDPRDGTVYVAWRRFASSVGSTLRNNTDAIMVTRSENHGRSFDPPGEARRFPRGRKSGLLPEWVFEHRRAEHPTEVAQLSPFDEATTHTSFRTNGYPSMTIDGTGRVYLAWAERGFAKARPDPITGDARVLVATSTNGRRWGSPVVADDPDLPGHQFMPTISFAGGRLLLVYYDQREDVSRDFGPYIDDASSIAYEHLRHTIDVRATEADPGAHPVFGPSVQVSSYLIGSEPPGAAGQPLRPVPCQPDGVGVGCEQLQFNPPNLPLFKQGTVPFIGDYIDVGPSPAFVPAPQGGWTYNTSGAATVFHITWTDNRDVVQPADGDWTHYTPPLSAANAGGTSVFDPSKHEPACVPGQTGMRNQNIYTSRVTDGLLVGSPGNTKPLSPDLQRAFVVFAQNATGGVVSYRLTIANQPPGGRASFVQFPLPPYNPQSPAPVTSLDATVAPYSMVARTVFVTSSDPHAVIDVTVNEITAPGGTTINGGLQGQVVLDPDVSNPDILNPDISNPDISNPDILNAEVYNPDISNPDISNPDISNPDILNPDISNPDISNVVVANPDISNPDISNPDILNPDISNPDISNPDISNPDISNASLTDVTWDVSNTGNTTASYNVDMFLATHSVPSGIRLQLILHKTSTTPVANGCNLTVEAHNLLVANIVNPRFVTPGTPSLPDPNNPDISNATLWLAPGEQGKVTLRIYNPDKSTDETLPNGVVIPPSLDPSTNPVRPLVSPEGVNTTDARNGITHPPVYTPAGFGSTVVFVQEPTGGVAGAPLTPEVQVQLRDPYGTVVPGATVTLALADNPPGATLTGATATTDASGIATFPSLTVSRAGTGYTLAASASAPNLTFPTVTSAPFDVTAASVVVTLTDAVNDIRTVKTQVSYTFSGAPDRTYALSFSSASACDAPAIGATAGSVTLTTDGNGSASGTAALNDLQPLGSGITARAFDDSANAAIGSSNCLTLYKGVFQWRMRQDGGNGHYYEYVRQPGTWETANAAALQRHTLVQDPNLNGTGSPDAPFASSHLVTIASAAENAFVDRLKGPGDMQAWIGLYDATGSFDWTWVTGEPFSYSNWDAGEPDHEGIDRWVEIFASGAWRNIADEATANQGYVVEYEPTIN